MSWVKTLSPSSEISFFLEFLQCLLHVGLQSSFGVLVLDSL